LIAAPPFTSERPKLPAFWQELQRQRDFQVVLINRQLRPALFHQVAADYGAGVERVVAELAARGHRRVAYISGVPAMLPIQQRLAAFRRCAKQAGFAQAASLFVTSPLTYAGGWQAGESLWRRNAEKPTAVVAFSDVVAVGLLRFLAQVGARVPAEVSVVSFDGTPIGEYTQTSLTTVVTPMYEIGQHAFALMRGALAGEFAAPQSIILPVELRLRESIGGAAEKLSAVHGAALTPSDRLV
jgi:LacI family transcriptional regulator